MCIACGMTQIPVCATVGACGGVNVFAQIITLSALSISLLIGTANLWFVSVVSKAQTVLRKK